MLKARPSRGGAIAQAIGRADDTDFLRWTRDVVAQVAGFEPAMQALSDAELAAQTAKLLAGHESGLDALLTAAFATVREASGANDRPPRTQRGACLLGGGA
jgi:preprotein translocase subunit SecA